MTRMTIDPFAGKVASGLLGLGITLLVVKGAVWSYPQGADTIWTVGVILMAAVAILSVREAWQVRRD